MSPLLQVKNVTKKYGGLTANNAISFDVAENEILSVIGPNGAGKSTLFKMIASFTPTTSGEVIYQGERISNLKPHIVARKGVVRTFQETTIFKNIPNPAVEICVRIKRIIQSVKWHLHDYCPLPG